MSTSEYECPDRAIQAEIKAPACKPGAACVCYAQTFCPSKRNQMMYNIPFYVGRIKDAAQPVLQNVLCPVVGNIAEVALMESPAEGVPCAAVFHIKLATGQSVLVQTTPNNLEAFTKLMREAEVKLRDPSWDPHKAAAPAVEKPAGACDHYQPTSQEDPACMHCSKMVGGCPHNKMKSV